jgi:hypothetical protein
MMPRVFISHATGDQRFVDQHIVSFLQSHGIETWYSREDIDTASHWEREILEGLKSCDWFLVVVSRLSLLSDWVNREVAWAEERRKGRIVPVVIDDSDPADLHLALVRIQHVDWMTFDGSRVPNSTGKRQRRVMQRPSTSWVSATRWDTVRCLMPQKRFGGTNAPPINTMSSPSTTSGIACSTGSERTRTTNLASAGAARRQEEDIPKHRTPSVGVTRRA